MVMLPWATRNLLIVFRANDIIREQGPCVRPLSVSHSLWDSDIKTALRIRTVAADKDGRQAEMDVESQETSQEKNDL